MNENMITHVIVGDHKYAHEIPHREHRLANYLSDHPRTEKVLWIYPSSKQKNTPNNNNNNTNDNGYSITEIAVPIQYRSVKIPNRMLDRPVFKIYFNKKIKSMINELTGDSCICGIILLYFHSFAKMTICGTQLYMIVAIITLLLVG